MQFTNNEFRYFAQLFEDLSEDSIFNRYSEPLNSDELEVVIKQLVSKQVLVYEVAGETVGSPTYYPPVDGMMAVLEILARPDRLAHFSLQYPDGNLYKAVFTKGDQRILLEFLEEDIMVSIYDTEAESVRQEISNQVGVSFQKASVFKTSLIKSELCCLLGVLDLLRVVKLLERTQSIPSKIAAPIITIETLTQVLHSPPTNGLCTALNKAVGLELKQLTIQPSDLIILKELGLIEQELEEPLHFGPTPLLNKLVSHFLLPDVLISLELSQPPYTSRELILQGSLKQALSISTSQTGYEIESLTGVEILNRIDGYLSCPILSE